MDNDSVVIYGHSCPPGIGLLSKLGGRSKLLLESFDPWLFSTWNHLHAEVAYFRTASPWPPQYYDVSYTYIFMRNQLEKMAAWWQMGRECSLLYIKSSPRYDLIWNSSHSEYIFLSYLFPYPCLRLKKLFKCAVRLAQSLRSYLRLLRTLWNKVFSIWMMQRGNRSTIQVSESDRAHVRIQTYWSKFIQVTM